MKLSNSNRRKWMRTYWRDTKDFLKQYGLIIILVIIINCLLGFMSAHNKAKDEYIQELEQYNKKLETEVDDLLETTVAYEEAYDALEGEVALFSSMFAGIENEPGGHEMLKKLYDQYK